MNSLRPNDRADVAGEIDGADDRLVELPLPEESNGNVERAQSGGRLARDRETRSSHPELPGDAAGNQATEGSHCAVGGQRGAGRVAQGLGPLSQLVLRKAEPELTVPLARFVEQRPADVKVRRVEVELDTDEHAGAEP